MRVIGRDFTEVLPVKRLPEKSGHTDADRERLARDWTDRAEDEEAQAGPPARETYRDGGLISECWNDRNE